MDLSRRDFLKATGIGGISLALSSLGFDLKEARAAAHAFKLKGAREFTSICHFCACGCGVIGYVKDGKLISYKPEYESTPMFQNEINAFVRCVQTGEKLPSHIDRNILTSKLMQGIYDSSDANREVVME